MKKHLLSGFLLSVCFCSCLTTQAQVKIEPTMMGQALWFSDFSDPDPTIPQSVDWNEVVASGVRLVRAGGNQYNTSTSFKPPFPVYYVRLVDNIRANGCEPVITIPFEYDPNTQVFSTQLNLAVANAQEIVRILNIVHKRHVKYFIIANEPGIDYGFTTTGDAIKIHDYTVALAKAVKDIDPEIKTIGPEHDWYNKAIYDLLFPTTGATAEDISGLIPSGSPSAGKPYIDYMSVHQYLYDFQSTDPNNLPPTTADETITWLEQIQKAQFDMTKRYRGVLKDMRDKCAILNASPTLRPGQPLKFMMTEGNETLFLEGTGTPTPDPNLSGLDTRSFIGGQLWARMYSLAMEYGCSSVMFWSVKEGCPPPPPSGTQTFDDRGYLAGCPATPTKRPSYYHYKKIAEYFNGMYLRDEILNTALTASSGNTIDDNPTANFWNPNISDFRTVAFANKGSNLAVMILNREASSTNVTIRFDGAAVGSFSGSAHPKKFSFNAVVAGGAEQNFTVDALSTWVLVFRCDGTLQQKYIYRQNTEAQNPASDFFLQNNISTPATVTSTISPANNPGICLNSGTSSITINSPATNYDWYKAPSSPSSPSSNPFQSSSGPLAPPLGSENTAVGLLPGAYITEVSGGTTMCAAVSVLNVIHHRSLLVDAGEDKIFCPGPSSGTIGNPNLPTTSSPQVTYSWTSGTTGCTAPTSGPTQNNPTIVSCNASTQYIMTASDGMNCSVSDAVNVFVNPTSTSKDIYIQDSPYDVGDQPDVQTVNQNNGVTWASTDIWVHNLPAAQTGINPARYAQENEHENPEWTNQPASTPYVYVKVRNRGCTPLSGKVGIYWANATTLATWPSSFSPVNPVIFATVSLLNPGEEEVVTLQWTNMAGNIGNPNNTGINHFCFVARFESTTPSDDPAINEDVNDGTYSVGNNTYWGNNFAWKNVTIVNSNNSVNKTHSVFVGNPVDKPSESDFSFVCVEQNKPFVNVGTIKINLGQVLYQKWKDGGKQGTGIVTGREKYKHTSLSGATHFHSDQVKNDNPYEIKIVSPNASLENLNFSAKEMYLISCLFNFTSPALNRDIFNWDMIQLNNDSGLFSAMGGERYIINYPDCPTANAGTNVTIGRNCFANLSASPSVQNAIYSWYNNATGALVGTGQTIQVSPRVTTTYEVEIKLPNGCIIYAIKTVTVNPKFRCAIVDCQKIDFKNKIIHQPGEIIKDREVVIDGFMRVAANSTLRIENTKMNFQKDAYLEIMPGGRLEIIGSELRGCNPTDGWGGIIVRGNNNDNLQMRISGSSITDATTPLSLEKVTGFTIENSTIEYGINGIELVNSKNFTIKENGFYGQDIAIKTSGTAAGTGSVIEKNYFAGNKTAISFSNDNHSKLDIKCNTFESYADYAIYSQNATLKSQGTLAEGAGNEFYSESPLANNKLRHTGNAMTYYYDPSNPITDGMNVQILEAQTDGGCISSSARLGKQDEENNGSLIQSGSQPALIGIIPNPATEYTTVYFNLGEQSANGEIVITNVFGEKVALYKINSNINKVDVDCSKLANGIYFNTLFVEGNTVGTLKMIVVK